MSKLTPYFAPAGSVIARILPDGDNELFLPFFSTHFMQPIKTGEVAWVLYPDGKSDPGVFTPGEAEGVSQDQKTFQGGGTFIGSVIKGIRGQTSSKGLFKRAVITKVILKNSYLIPSEEPELFTLSNDVISFGEGYWFGRITGSRLSEDLNFTHIDRDLDTRATCRLSGKKPEDVLGKLPDGSPMPYFPSFTNGMQAQISLDNEADNDDIARSNQTYTYGDTPDAYEDLLGSGYLVREPVPPPFKESEGAFIINGSNNTRIRMGTYGTPTNVTVDMPAGENLSKGVITLSAGAGLSGAPLLTPAASLTKHGFYEQEKCPELRSDIDVLDSEDIKYSNWTSSQWGMTNFQAQLTVAAHAEPQQYIVGASSQSTFAATVPNADPQNRPKNIHQLNLDDDDADPLVVGNADSIGSLISGQADHIRFGGRESLRIGVDGGAEIILHRDGNIFLKPGPDGQVYLGGGPDELVDELATDDMEVATYCDIVTYPSADPALGLAAEMGMINKLPEPGKASGRRYSPKVKVKS